MLKNKFFIKLGLIITLIVIFSPALFVLFVDPIQVYHDQISLRKTKYFKEQRHQNLGLINKYLVRENKHSILIFGTSMSENFLSVKFKKYIKNDNVLKLTMSGGKPLEQFTLVKKALETGSVKKVIWDIHTYYLYKSTSQIDKKHTFPYKLYSDNRLKQAFFYLFNKDYIKSSFEVFTGKVDWGRWTEDADKLNYWMDRDVKKGKFSKYISKENIAILNSKIIDRSISYKDVLESKYKYQNIDQYIFDLISKYPNVEFNFFFPPYSTWFYRSMKTKDVYRFLYARKYFVEKIKMMDNVKVYGFDNNYDITNKISNYKDYGHYKNWVNDYIMDSIMNNKHEIVNDNLNEYLRYMVDNINSYDSVELKLYKGNR